MRDGEWVQVVCDVCGANGGWMSADGGWDPLSPCPCGRSHRVCLPCRDDGEPGRAPFAVCPLSDEVRVAKEVMA